MKKLIGASILFLALFVLLAGCNQADEEDELVEENGAEEQAESTEGAAEMNPAHEEKIKTAETYIDHLAEGNYEAATENFDETMSSLTTADELEELWVNLNNQMGDFIDYEFKSVQEADGFQVVLITGIFNDTDATFQVTVDEDEQIAGFYIQ